MVREVIEHAVVSDLGLDGERIAVLVVHREAGDADTAVLQDDGVGHVIACAGIRNSHAQVVPLGINQDANDSGAMFGRPVGVDMHIAGGASVYVGSKTAQPETEESGSYGVGEDMELPCVVGSADVSLQTCYLASDGVGGVAEGLQTLAIDDHMLALVESGAGIEVAYKGTIDLCIKHSQVGLEDRMAEDTVGRSPTGGSSAKGDGVMDIGESAEEIIEVDGLELDADRVGGMGRGDAIGPDELRGRVEGEVVDQKGGVGHAVGDEGLVHAPKGVAEDNVGGIDMRGDEGMTGVLAESGSEA